ncbi:MAG: ABC transporter substrate-binding protein [Hyphomicrobiales bacterium]
MNRLGTLTGALAITAFAAVQSAVADPVVVASKIDTEGGVLGNIILRALQAGNIPVENKIQLGTTPIVRQAIIQGQIDIYPEYTGNAAFFFNKTDLPVWNKAEAGYEEAKTLDYDANKIIWLMPANANNTWAIAVRGDIARGNNLKTLSELGAYIAEGGKIKLAASSEFVSSPTALPAFEKIYGFHLKPDQLITLSGGDTAATIAAAARQISGANAAMVYGTDGGVAPSGLTVMEDDKGVQPVYLPTPIIRKARLDEYPRIADILKPIFAALDLETLQALNARVQVGGEPADTVARDFLTSNGFVK